MGWFLITCASEIVIAVFQALVTTGANSTPRDQYQTIRIAVLSVILGINCVLLFVVFVFATIVFIRTQQKAKLYSTELMFNEVNEEQVCIQL